MTATETVRRYVEDVIHRARVPMPPYDYTVNWNDQPRRHKVYPGAASFTLPVGPPVTDALATALDRTPWTDGDGPLDPARLGRALNDTYGLLARRLRVTGNDDAVNKPRSAVSTYSRGTANGGGLYPLEMYWVSGASADQTPGVYHWDTASGALQRLIAGNVSDRVRAALPEPAPQTDQFLLVSVKFWKNSFKYNSFCHHVVTMDLGATLASLELLGVTDGGAAAVPHLWFDSAELDALLGIESLDETTLAVLPLPPGPRGLTVPERSGDAAVTLTEAERSRVTHRFDQVTAVVEATLVPQALPDVEVVSRVAAPASPEPVPLPEVSLDAVEGGVSAILARRRSSFGTFSSKTPLSAEELATLLRVTARGCRLRTDAGRADFARLAVFVNHVAGIAPGAYLYDEERSGLVLVDGEAPGELLQTMYFLDNYNVEQAAAVISVLVPVESVLDAVGDRGVRLLNAVVGSATQSCYVAASALDVACGAALGFDNVSYAERLRLSGSDEWPMIMLMVGRDRDDQADFAYPLSARSPKEST
ncbi:SagB-type dehydrogenase family enzyme [Stackebrandtia albiflava]|uniref:SagB-type dehydrogenase family enzyme n=1 Tax=Stackebrandtia albiflava TaxID=406432 RepID=A0A562VBX3_9ACTN|nr:hypothetical protein [Stackebrandtia albiflava]TWJ15385.1 SagB-type dehydrogenase family enzyme [Stackebrandtia albiflava]